MPMKMLTPTHFRKTMFATLREVIHGSDILVQTREGGVLMRRAGQTRKTQSDLPKIPGHIREELGPAADAALRNHIEWPAS
jgi:hypothetical protein